MTGLVAIIRVEIEAVGLVNRIKAALNAKSEKDAINFVLRQFDTDLQLAEVTIKDAGTLHFEEI